MNTNYKMVGFVIVEKDMMYSNSNKTEIGRDSARVVVPPPGEDSRIEWVRQNKKTFSL